MSGFIRGLYIAFLAASLFLKVAIVVEGTRKLIKHNKDEDEDTKEDNRS